MTIKRLARACLEIAAVTPIGQSLETTTRPSELRRLPAADRIKASQNGTRRSGAGNEIPQRGPKTGGLGYLSRQPRTTLDPFNARLALAFIASQGGGSVGFIAQAGGQHNRVLKGLAASLPVVGGHRVGGVAE